LVLDIFPEVIDLIFQNLENRSIYIKVRRLNLQILELIIMHMKELLISFWSFYQQRCGYNLLLMIPAQQKMVLLCTSDNRFISNWCCWRLHSSSDYAQFSAVSASTVFQLLFAFQQYPNSFKDKFREKWNPWPNGIPDILDEAKWDRLDAENESSSIPYSINRWW